MSMFDLVGVAIGVIFVFLLLSLICTALYELAEAFLKRRAADLERGIREMLGDENGQDIVKQFYDHPLILSLYKGAYQANQTHNLPSYIPKRNFALALLDIVAPEYERNGNAAAQPKPLRDVIQTIENTELRDAILSLVDAARGDIQEARENVEAWDDSPARTSTLALLNISRGGGDPNGKAAVQPKSPPLRDVVSKNANEHVHKALLPLIDAAGDNVQQLHLNVEEWYDSVMDRVSGWYKRRAQKVLFVIGLALTIALNADAIAITSSIATDVQLREALVAASQGYAQAAPTAPTTPTPDPSSPIAECRRDVTSPECRVQSILAQLRQLGVPLGWDSANPRSVPPVALTWAWVFKVIGWLCTALAISLGAPFWFDLLNKFLVIRSTVKPKEKSPEEGSEDRQQAQTTPQPNV